MYYRLARGWMGQGGAALGLFGTGMCRSHLCNENTPAHINYHFPKLPLGVLLPDVSHGSG